MDRLSESRRVSRPQRGPKHGQCVLPDPFGSATVKAPAIGKRPSMLRIKVLNGHPACRPGGALFNDLLMVRWTGRIVFGKCKMQRHRAARDQVVRGSHSAIDHPSTMRRHGGAYLFRMCGRCRQGMSPAHAVADGAPQSGADPKGARGCKVDDGARVYRGTLQAGGIVCAHDRLLEHVVRTIGRRKHR